MFLYSYKLNIACHNVVMCLTHNSLTKRDEIESSKIHKCWCFNQKIPLKKKISHTTFSSCSLLGGSTFFVMYPDFFYACMNNGGLRISTCRKNFRENFIFYAYWIQNLFIQFFSEFILRKSRVMEKKVNLLRNLNWSNFIN